MSPRTCWMSVRIACLPLLLASACDGGDELECGEGTVERDGACVVGGTAGDGAVGDDDEGADGGDGAEGGGNADGDGGEDDGDGGFDDDFDDGGDDEGGSGDEPGECVGEPWGCGQFDGERACLGQDGCYPVLNCVGTEADCLDLGYGTQACDDAPHCYSDTMQAGGTTLPGCWPYDYDCLDGDPRLEPCEAFGGTCEAANTCEGDPESCEWVAGGKAGCEAHRGCFWKPD